jgi:hypothetical protein
VLTDELIPTSVHTERAAYTVGDGATYFFSQSPEERSHFPPEWKNAQRCDFVQIDELSDGLTVRVVESGDMVSLRSDAQVASLVNLAAGKLVVDITGMSHHLWAPLVRAGLRTGLPLDVVYVEPGEYRFSDVPRAGEIFDLSEKIRGISPLPGFTRTSRRFDREFIFVPLLGFEGARYAYVAEQTQPEPGFSVPIVGVPGFRPEYPFYAFEGNQPPLETSQAWKDTRFAAANCPFELFRVLAELSSKFPDRTLRVAPIGTKPHAVGAVMFAVRYPDRVELIYDHPVRKPGRTEGEFRTLVYSLSVFAESWT